MKIAATTILYNPADNFLENIKTYASFVDKVYVIDNSDNPQPERINQIAAISNAVLVTNYKNKGIATALNQGINCALNDDFDWILTMDQDSAFQEQYIKRYLSALINLPESGKIAATGIIHESRNLLTEPVTAEVNLLITSGTMINVKIFVKLGGYEEKLFIDDVDHDYCFRAKIAGYSLILFQYIFMEHTLGEIKTVPNLTGKRKLNRNLHSSIRLYYIIRNSRYVNKRFGKIFPKEIAVKKRDVLIRIKNRLLYGDNKLYSLKLIFLGYWHSIIGRYGKL